MLAQYRASYILEMDECEKRKGSYCNWNQKEKEQLEYKDQLRKEERKQWKDVILPHLIREAEYVTKRKLVQRTVPPWE